MDADAHTIERLLRERAWLRRLAGALVGDAHAADDIAQQAYVAAHLGVPVETVRTRLKRALAKLRRSLDAEHGGDRRLWAAPLLLWAEPSHPALVGAAIGGMVVTKKSLACLVIAVVGVFLAARWVPNLIDGRSTPESARTDVERADPTSAPEGPTLRGAPPAADPGEPPSVRETAEWALVGRVVYPGRVPAAGVRVRLFAGRAASVPDEAGVTDARGRFRLRPRGPFEEGLRMFRLAAEDGDGNVASRAKYNVSVPREDDADAGMLVLEPGHELLLRVESRGAPVPGAEIEVHNAGYQRHSHLARLTTDGDGLARVGGLLPLLYRVEARADGLAAEVALVSLPQADGEPYRIVLDPPRTLEVRVVEAPEMRPLAGVEVRVFRSLAWANTSSQWRLPLRDPIPRTDARGRTRVDGIGRSPHLRLGILARGYARPTYDHVKKVWDAYCQKTVPIPAHEDTLEIVVPAGRRVTWPLVVGDAPVPPEGTLVHLDVARSGMRPYGVEIGVVEGGRLVVDGLVEGYFTARGRTPGGLVARVVALPKESEGAPLAFWRPRTLEVVVAREDGTPLPKVSVKLDAEEGPQITTPFASTDAEGVARWADLPAIRGTVRPNVPPRDAHPVDLTSGDRRIELRGETPEERRTHALAIRVLLDGRPGLPDRYELDVAEYHASIALEREEETSGTLHVRWAPPPRGDTGRFVLEARGYQPAPFAVSTGTEEAEVGLERGCALHVAYLHEVGQRVRCHLERYDVAEREWETFRSRGATRPGVNRVPLNPPAVGYESRYDGFPPGRYRVVDDRTQRRSEAVVLAAGGPTATITFDCRPATEVEGRVVVPSGYAAEAAVVQVFAGTEVFEVSADAKGRFAFPWPADAGSVRLIARHPLLRPHAEHGHIVLSAPRESVRLELVPGPIAEVEIHVPLEGDERFVPSRTVRVHLLSTDDPAAPATVLPARLEGRDGGTWLLAFGGYEPGTWTLWSDLGHRLAPLRLPRVVLDELDPSLGPVSLTRGSTIRIRVETADGKPPELLTATAEYEGTPGHRRMNAVVEEAEIVLTGLEAGRYHLTAGPVDPVRDEPPTAIDEIVEVDGSSTWERVIRTP